MGKLRERLAIRTRLGIAPDRGAPAPLATDPAAVAPAPPFASPPTSYDSWLSHYHGELLGELDAALADPPPNGYRLFRRLDDDLWTVLLFREYSLYPNIRAFLPDLPEASLQRRWNFADGMSLAPRTQAFYGKLKDQFAAHGGKPLRGARVLDFGCGWGRMTRFIARDLKPGNLCGCDPSQQILDLCEQLRVPGHLQRSRNSPDRLPFERGFDLVFAHSVFTHLPEATHHACLGAIHGVLEPGGIVVLTVRPPAFLDKPQMARLREELDGKFELDQPRYYFEPHASTAPGAAASYGNTFITRTYMEKSWTRLFELIEFSFMVDSMVQVVVTLRRREP